MIFETALPSGKSRSPLFDVHGVAHGVILGTQQNGGPSRQVEEVSIERNASNRSNNPAILNAKPDKPREVVNVITFLENLTIPLAKF